MLPREAFGTYRKPKVALAAQMQGIEGLGATNEGVPTPYSFNSN